MASSYRLLLLNLVSGKLKQKHASNNVMDRINQRPCQSADVFVVHLQDELSSNAQSLSELKMGGRQMHRDLLGWGVVKRVSRSDQ